MDNGSLRFLTAISSHSAQTLTEEMYANYIHSMSKWSTSVSNTSLMLNGYCIEPGIEKHGVPSE